MKGLSLITVVNRRLPNFHEKSAFLQNMSYLRQFLTKYPVDIYLHKVSNRNKRCVICSKLTIKTPERGRSDVFTVDFDTIWHISHHFLVFLLVTLNNSVLPGYCNGSVMQSPFRIVGTHCSLFLDYSVITELSHLF